MIYKNVSTEELMLPNIGTVKPGETIETDQELVNPNLQIENSSTSQPQVEKPVEPVEPEQPLEN